MNKKVLLVDDDPVILSHYKHMLGGRMQVETAKDPIEAIKLLKSKGPFAVVVSDIYMPYMDGIQFLSRVDELSPDTIKIILTGYPSLQKTLKAVNEFRVFGFFEKTQSLTDLIHAVKAGLQHYHETSSSKKRVSTKNILSTEEIAFLSDKSFKAPEEAPGASLGVDGESFNGGLETAQDRFDQDVLDLQREAYLDALTDLPNRYLFEITARQTMAQAERALISLALLSIHIQYADDEATIPGKEMDNELLINVSRIIRSRLRKTDYLARIDQDNLVVLLWDVDGEAGVQKVVTDIYNALQEPIPLTGGHQQIRVNVGASFFPKDAKELDLLIVKASNHSTLFSQKQ